MKDGKKVRKSNRLRFKRQKLQSVDDLPKLEKDSPPESEYSSKEVPPKSKSSKLFNSNELIEWGPFINGYRFVGSQNGKPLNFKKRHTLVNENYRETDTYNWSYMQLPNFQSKNDSLKEKYTEKSSEFGYDEYFKEWEYIKEHGLRDIVFPIIDENDELNKINVENFFKKSDQDYFNVLKIERIRWHPDKMIRTLKLDINDKLYKELAEKITKTFQIINQLWEEYKK